MFGVLPASGFYCRHVAGLQLRDIEIRPKRPDLRSVLVCDDVRDLVIDALGTRVTADAAPTIVLNDVHGARLQGCVAPRDANTFVRLSGDTDAVLATGNDLSAAAIPFEWTGAKQDRVLFEAGNRLAR
jgi:hypothetical protein